jgi:formylglycine-generating enzyme required for sulfatase activity
LKSSGYKPAEPIDWNKVYKYSPTDKHPMIYVTWHDATAYAKWVGKRLPAEAEWEFAARGGLVGKEFPWGDDFGVARDYANYKGTGGKDKWEFTAPVGSFKPNGYGIFDMPGNVWEWCQDSDKTKRVLRGGSWYNNPNSLRAATRYIFNPSLSNDFNGFRCVSGFPVAQQ